MSHIGEEKNNLEQCRKHSKIRHASETNLRLRNKLFVLRTHWQYPVLSKQTVLLRSILQIPLMTNRGLNRQLQ